MRWVTREGRAWDVLATEGEGMNGGLTDQDDPGALQILCREVRLCFGQAADAAALYAALETLETQGLSAAGVA